MYSRETGRKKVGVAVIPALGRLSQQSSRPVCATQSHPASKQGKTNENKTFKWKKKKDKREWGCTDCQNLGSVMILAKHSQQS